VNTKAATNEGSDKARKRDRLRREVAFLKAIGAPPQRLLVSRSERNVLERVTTNHAGGVTGAVSDYGALRSLAKHVREQMRPHLEEARRTLLTQVRAMSADSPASQVDEARELLAALRVFDPDGQQLDEAGENLDRLVHGETPRLDSNGGATRRNC
jgi:hypothetical protein